MGEQTVLAVLLPHGGANGANVAANGASVANLPRGGANGASVANLPRGGPPADGPELVCDPECLWTETVLHGDRRSEETHTLA